MIRDFKSDRGNLDWNINKKKVRIKRLHAFYSSNVTANQKLCFILKELFNLHLNHNLKFLGIFLNFSKIFNGNLLKK